MMVAPALLKTCHDRATVVAWMRRPLCRRYLTVVFSSTTAPMAAAAAGYVVHWALGQLVTGEVEILGAWNCAEGQGAGSIEEARSLHSRGAEFAGFVLSDGNHEESAASLLRAQPLASLEHALAATAAQVALRHKPGLLSALRAVVDADSHEAALAEMARFGRTGLCESYPGVIQLWDKALAPSNAVVKLSAPMWVLVRSADRTAATVCERLAREIQRHGPFDDPDAALDFVSGALLRAERRLDRAWAAGAAAGAGAASSLARPGGGSMSTGAVGVPTLA